MTFQGLLAVVMVCPLAGCGAELASGASGDASSLEDGSSALDNESSAPGDPPSRDGGSPDAAGDASINSFAADSDEADSSPDSGEKALPDSGFCSEEEGPVPSLIAGSVACKKHSLCSPIPNFGLPVHESDGALFLPTIYGCVP
jgi:hypothetical protein